MPEEKVGVPAVAIPPIVADEAYVLQVLYEPLYLPVRHPQLRRESSAIHTGLAGLRVGKPLDSVVDLLVATPDLLPVNRARAVDSVATIEAFAADKYGLRVELFAYCVPLLPGKN